MSELAFEKKGEYTLTRFYGSVSVPEIVLSEGTDLSDVTISTEFVALVAAEYGSDFFYPPVIFLAWEAHEETGKEASSGIILARAEVGASDLARVIQEKGRPDHMAVLTYNEYSSIAYCPSLPASAEPGGAGITSAPAVQERFINRY